MKRGLKCLAKMLSAIPVYPDITQKRHSNVLFSFWTIRVTLQSAHHCLLAGDSRLFPYLTEVIKQCGYLVGLQLYCSSQWKVCGLLSSPSRPNTEHTEQTLLSISSIQVTIESSDLCGDRNAMPPQLARTTADQDCSRDFT